VTLFIWQILCLIFALLLGLCLYLAYHLKDSLDKSLTREEDAYSELLDFPDVNPNPVMRINKSGALIYANAACSPILVFWQVGLQNKIPAQWREIIRQVLLADNHQSVELSCFDKDYSLNFVPMKQGFVSIFGMDITERKAIEKELEKRTTVDDLTNLPNRIIFNQNLALEINHAKAAKSKFGVLIVRLDDYFEVVNTYGQNTAESLLLAFCERLSDYTNDQNSLASLSDNEFGIITPSVSTPSMMVSFAQGLIEKCTTPYKIGERDIFVTLSIGIAFYPADGDSMDILTRNAQLAVNRTSHTRNQYEFFQRGMADQLQVKRAIITDLHKALTNNELMVYYQPQIDLKQRKMIGAEALLRWNHPEKGFISPAFFIPAAEETQLIMPIGEWVLRQVCQQLIQWQHAGYPSIKIAVNVSARQFFQSDIVDIVRTVIRETKISPEWLEIELTESAVVQNMDKAIEIMKGLRALGVELSLDDFGTGYSSLSYLMQFPVNKLKIDRSFVKIIEDDSSQYAVTKGIIELGHSLNLSVIAEGVETKAQLQYLKKHNCDLIQGFYFSEAQPPEKFPALFKAEWKS